MQANSICIWCTKNSTQKICTVYERNYVPDLPELFKGVTYHGTWTLPINPDISLNCSMSCIWLYLRTWSLTNNCLKYRSVLIKELEVCFFFSELINSVQIHGTHRDK